VLASCRGSRCSVRPRPPPSPLFPYTTLFRSRDGGLFRCHNSRGIGLLKGNWAMDLSIVLIVLGLVLAGGYGWYVNLITRRNQVRSEEHTSELQSRENLVCRLLLENKKTAMVW